MENNFLINHSLPELFSNVHWWKAEVNTTLW